MTHQHIISTVCNYYGLDPQDVTGHRRYGQLPEARQIIWWLLRRHTSLGVSSIGRMFFRDHTTVVHGVQKINGLIEVDKGFARQVEYIESKIS